ncbi:helicase POLQ-like [Lineus longissimus]|uniref:helicase POLQ-like n=1 Tax=Lineus longissimus TaxID=88925 RepID=UPI00315C8042
MAEDHLSRKVSSRKRTRTQHHDIDLPQKKYHSQSLHDNKTNPFAVEQGLRSAVKTSPVKVAAKTWFSSSFQNERSKKVASLSRAQPPPKPPPTTDVWLGKKVAGVVDDNEGVCGDLSSTDTPMSKRTAGKHTHQQCPAISQDLCSASNSSSDIFNESDGQFDIDAIWKLEDEYFSQNSVKNHSQRQTDTEMSEKQDKCSDSGTRPQICGAGENSGKTDISGNQSLSSCAKGSFGAPSQNVSERYGVGPTAAATRASAAAVRNTPAAGSGKSTPASAGSSPAAVVPTPATVKGPTAAATRASAAAVRYTPAAGSGRSTPASARSIPAAVVPTPATVKGPTPATVKSIPAVVRSTPAAARSIPAAVVPTPATVRSIPAIVRSTPAAARSIPAAVVPTPATVKSIPAVVRSTPAAARSIPAAVVPTPARTGTVKSSQTPGLAACDNKGKGKGEIHVQLPSRSSDKGPRVLTNQNCDKRNSSASSEIDIESARRWKKRVPDHDRLDFDHGGYFSEEFVTGAPNLTVSDTSSLKSETLCREGSFSSNEFKSLVTPKGLHPSVGSNVNPVWNSGHKNIVTTADNVKKNDSSVTPKVSNINDKCQVTPARAPSLKDKLKQRLQENAQKSTPQNLRMQNLRRESLELAKREAETIQKEGAEYDIGPFYGLPSKVRGLFEKLRGISKFYDWQHECLTLESVRHGKNLIYSLPTSGGKTLVAEILILQSLLCKKKDALLILPFISVVQEKVRNLAAFGVDLNFLVEEYAGSKGCFPPKKRRTRKSIYICTIEKSRTLISSLIEAGRIEEMGLVVVDELHMLGEGGGRGACLELALAKVMYASPSVQIIGMSATLNNISDLQTFLKAELYTSDFRPVSLTEHVKFEDKLYEVKPRSDPSEDKLQLARILTFPYSKEMLKNDPDLLLGLVMEVIPNHSCLVFCPTKKNCENVAKMLCKMMPRNLMQVKTDEKKLLLKTLTEDNNGQICPVLFRTIPYGVAYHHSGLTMDERKGIEEAYSDGTLCMLTCTSTLAAGVNLPAKRVILRSPYVGPKFLSRSQYKQMIGRAGRAGIDTSGESILVMKSTDLKKVKELIDGPFEKCCSSLMYQDDKGVRALMLSIIGLKLADSSAKAVDFLNQTLFAVQSKDSKRDITATTQNALQQLLELQLIKQVKNDDGLPLLEVTPLGRATFKSGIDFSHAKHLHTDLLQARDSLVVANYLHLLYLATPYDMVDQVYVSWKIYMEEFTSLGPSEVKVANQLGITDSYITKKVSGQVIRKVVDKFVVSRFYLTLMLYDLWNQHSIWDVAAKYLQPRGFIQNLLTGAATFAACIKHFCQEIDEFWAYQDLLGNFVKKLSFCVSSELIPLMEVPGVKQARAKQLHQAGYATVTQLAHADPEKLIKEVEQMPRKVAKSIIASAKMLLNDMVESLKDEVEDLIAMPNGADVSMNANMDIDMRWFEDDLSIEKG